MATINVLNIQGQTVESLELNEAIFDTEVNGNVLHEVVKNYLANQRQGTHAAKTRAEVRGGGRKPFKQKGTGNARQGTIRAPHFVGGGVVFAKKPRDFSYTLPKKVKRLAIKSALSAKFQANELIILDQFQLEGIKTKQVVEALNNVNAGKKTLVLTEVMNENVYKSARNIAGVKATFVGEINVYDILNTNTLILTKSAVQKIEEVYA
ncbi:MULTISPECIES: 50S ribosomal protein L4 [unclassified Fusibacter]|uniref:50S ribosomal protein L4 n=1 Tax=unclassified Fusibacter TaxID=2624464 RepID=UPI0010117339|nr:MULTISPECIES: 50S ribosomal protein L4 [unclassified Fusibacter]MCK8061513.1 50S ribosomal protein L4 [Fusibacter sp. A2]NPE23759.1 50S ribosomal protein L4 [Fusibacter sp. A1]RXV58786.1 50S ribosomal protein L4 [Fusibacter sp. A1]